MRLGYFTMAFLFFAIVLALSAFAANAPSGGGDAVRGGGLMCRSIDGQHGVSCDELCAKVEMVCTSVAASKNPPLACSDLIDATIAPFPVCRCCGVTY